MVRPMFVLLVLLGCQNACQDLCQTMATRAAECGLSVTQDELESCVTSNPDPSPDWELQCLDANDAARLQEWWSCDDLKENYTNGAK